MPRQARAKRPSGPARYRVPVAVEVDAASPEEAYRKVWDAIAKGEREKPNAAMKLVIGPQDEVYGA